MLPQESTTTALGNLVGESDRFSSADGESTRARLMPLAYALVMVSRASCWSRRRSRGPGGHAEVSCGIGIAPDVITLVTFMIGDCAVPKLCIGTPWAGIPGDTMARFMRPYV
jgi:hypothetical protein